jgi:hypothetical protein
MRGTKRKALHDQIFDIAHEDKIQRVKIVEIKEKEKSRRAKAKSALKHDLEVAKMRHAADEAAKQRAHEARMMELQMNFQMRHEIPAHAPALVNFGPFGHPPPQRYDPILLNQGL